MKLSVPQYRLLVKLLDGPKPIAEYYPPARALVRLGLAVWVMQPCRSIKLEITHAGRERI